jgi:hypothetical protein
MGTACSTGKTNIGTTTPAELLDYEFNINILSLEKKSGKSKLVAVIDPLSSASRKPQARAIDSQIDVCIVN